MRILALVPLAALSVSLLAACDDGGPAAPPLDPGIIEDAMNRSMESTFSMDATVDAGPFSITMTGAMDVSAGLMRLTMDSPDGAMDMMLVDEIVYLAIDGPNGEPWLALDPALLPATSSLRGALDLDDQTGIVAGVVTVEETGPGKYEGRIDLNQAVAEHPSLAMAAASVRDASNIHYEASIDDEGRLTELDYTLATNAATLRNEISFGDFGEPIDVQAPLAEDVWEATDDIYEQV